MAIVAMKHLRLLGMESEREALLKAASAGQPAPEHIAELASEEVRAQLEPQAMRSAG